jgi:hypothetical protein
MNPEIPTNQNGEGFQSEESKNLYKDLGENFEGGDDLANLGKQLEGFRADLPGGINPEGLGERIEQIYDKIRGSGEISKDDLADVIELANSFNNDVKDEQIKGLNNAKIINLENLLSQYIKKEAA